jgi:hypothetical protein
MAGTHATHFGTHPLETIPHGEDAAIGKVVEISIRAHEKDGGRRRGQHPKHHGLVRAVFRVDPSKLPPECRVGLFREKREFPALIRFSNGGKDDDRLPDVHGMAIKLMDVDGEKVLTAEKDARTHDFILVDNPSFFVQDAIDYAPFSEAFAKAKGVNPSIVRSSLFFLSDERRGGMALITSLIASLGLGKAMAMAKAAKQALSKTPASPLTSRFWSTTPYALGRRAVKYMVVPTSTAPPPEAGPDGSPESAEREAPENLLRKALWSTLRGGGAGFSFFVQLDGAPEKTPVENPMVEWKESDAPPIQVAEIVIPPQVPDTRARMALVENLSFTPWHALPDHVPIGGINRTRLRVYREVSARRHERNGVPQAEPTPADVDAACGEGAPA